MPVPLGHDAQAGAEDRRGVGDDDKRSSHATGPRRRRSPCRAGGMAVVRGGVAVAVAVRLAVAVLGARIGDGEAELLGRDRVEDSMQLPEHAGAG